MNNSTPIFPDNDNKLTPLQESELIKLLGDLKQMLLHKSSELSVCPEWVPKKIVQNYLGYGDTQFSALVLSKDLTVAKVGRRLFVNRQSLIALLERNIQR